MIRILMLALVVLAIVGCATPYQSRGLAGGFSETQLDENVFQVSFRGNTYTSSQRAADFTLLRSAELAIENGYRYFVIVDAERYSQTGAYTTPTTSHTTGSVYGSGHYAYGSATTTTTGGQTYFYSKPRSSNTIIMFREQPELDGLVYDAEFVARSIREKHGIVD
ncbi:hypothetical protein OCT51_10405 [Halomonas sp. LR3S48]|uniref:CC0125/CC1285 family lipoprotein n=1 Tax=Halomonas sp. LR3S48 TaxID=2982694 RepID=UPI0021E3B6CA|nr:hypothetical protein [Halomonas sp. LR3S48]UYG05742.1 hypothetical protein OCT51_10405 [Halomonas sp. LR3S48]